MGGDEHGSVLVITAVWMSALLIAMMFVVEASNWWVHKRHLQMQADAAALAAAGKFVIPCTDQPIRDEAQKYSGAPGSSFNTQVGGTPVDRIHMLMNSTTWFNQSSPVDTTVNTAGPCAASMIDVKMTETDLPWFFRSLSVPFINAHARVAIKQVTTQAGALPVAVPEVNPKSARATFIDESTGTELGHVDLTRDGTTAGGLAQWDNATTPLPVAINKSNIGVRIAIAGSTNPTCGTPLVECYDASSANGLLSIRGWDTSGSGTQPNSPVLKDATLLPGTCSDSYLSTNSGNCNLAVSAKVDAGAIVSDSSKFILTATVNGVANSKVTLTCNSSGQCSSPAGLTIAPASGVNTVQLNWEEQSGQWRDSTGTLQTCTKTGNNKCKGTFGTVQRQVGAVDTVSGPIQIAEVGESGVSLSGANSFPKCSSVVTNCTHNMVVKIALQGSLADAQSVSDPVTVLRVAGGGSQNQSLDCDPNLSQLRDEIAQGCAPAYTVNTGTACPTTTSSLWGSPPPWNCVAIQTGAATNQVPAGMNQRVLGDPKATTCTNPNHWSQFPYLSQSDPRIVQVFLTPYGTFSGSGSGIVPVSNFATFYVTGWGASGSGFANPCQGNGDDVIAGNKSGFIYGHFIKYIQTLNNGSGGTQPCDLTSFGSCIAELVE